MPASDPDALRSEILERWEHAATGWGAHAERMREFGMPVSAWMIEHARLQPGQRVLELAAGPGDTGFLAAELIRPGGTLLSTDATENMLEVARARANELGIENVEFKRIELEWIDLDTASVDVVLCKWGLMFAVDPEAALREARRVLRPGGRIALAAWDEPRFNDWATIPTRALVEFGHIAPPDPDAPGMFILSAPGRLKELLESAGFLDAVVESVETPRSFAGVDDYIAETREISSFFGEKFEPLSAREREEVVQKMAELSQTHIAADGSVSFTGRSLVAAADA
ncbi:MAG TPA: methyltransferase domain-containing protein [Solirubrobacteraceae bacterium]|nr:methyltransferase domain-containing protein [Solirubrobacteraceae bacterium]